jgi:chaperonin GroEL
MQKGINVIAEAVRPTLGPLPRHVAIDRIVKSESQKYPEMLDNGGLIARRILQLSDPDADMGAMFFRQLLWQQHQEAGDGTALTAVLFQSVYNQGLKYIAAGGGAMRLRSFLEKGLRIILNELKTLSEPLIGEEKIVHLAESVCHDEALARVLGEVFDVIGAYGQLEVRSGHGRETRREFIQGSYFGSGVLSEHMIVDRALARVQMENAAILISDLEFDDPKQIIPIIQTAFENSIHKLVVVARKLSDQVISVLLTASRQPGRFQVIAVKAPDALHGQTAFIEDLEVLTGGRAFLRAAGDRLDTFQLHDLGAARLVWADKEYFCLIGAKGSAQAISSHAAKLRAAYANAEKSDDRTKLQERIGKLLRGSAIIWVGGLTKHDIEARKQLAERTTQTIRGTLLKGILPGGGVSLLACRTALNARVRQTEDLDEVMAYRILARALEEPLRTIVTNAGYDPGEIIRAVGEASRGSGFDVRCGAITDMIEVGVIDSADTVITAVQKAVATAALALTVDVLVHHRNPETAFEP